MVDTALSPTRALRRARHIDGRAVFGVLLLLVATVGSITVWSASSGRDVVVATRDLAAGATLTPSDVAIARVRIDEPMYAAAVPAAELDTLVGTQLAEPIHAQQLLVQAQLSRRPALRPGQVVLALPVSPDTAAGGRMQAGDRVRVLLTIDKGRPEARTTVAVPRATVAEVGHDERVGAVGTNMDERSPTGGPVTWLTLIVTEDEALQLARARWAGVVDLALLPSDETQGDRP